MIQVDLLEKQIQELDDASFSKLRDWFFELDQARCDENWTLNETTLHQIDF